MKNRINIYSINNEIFIPTFPTVNIIQFCVSMVPELVYLIDDLVFNKYYN